MTSPPAAGTAAALHPLHVPTLPPPAGTGPRPHRGTGLVLLVCAVAVSGAGWAAVDLTVTGRLPHVAPWPAGVVAAVLLLAHATVRLAAPGADPLLLPLAVLLDGLGLVLLHRLDLALPAAAPAAPPQLVWSALGAALCALTVGVLRHHRTLGRYALLTAVVALLALSVPALFPAVNGAHLWVRAGSLSLQPGELAKVLLVVFLAAWLAGHRGTLVQPGRRVWGVLLPGRAAARALGPAVAVWLLCVAVSVLEHDLGSALLFTGVFVVLLYAATGRVGWIAVGAVPVGPCVWAVTHWEPHAHARLAAWLDPFASADAGHGAGQLAQSLYAFAAGGLLGTGLGRGHATEVGFAARTDFLPTTAGEELGLAGFAALLVLYALLVTRGFATALALRDPFGRLLAAGLAALVALEVFVIVGGVTSLVPLTGMALPFLAQGGSSLVVHWLIVALLVRTGDTAHRDRHEKGNENQDESENEGEGGNGDRYANDDGPGPGHGSENGDGTGGAAAPADGADAHGTGPAVLPAAPRAGTVAP